MAAKKRTTKAKRKASSIALELGNSVAAIRNLGEELAYGVGPVSAATVTICIKQMTAEMLRDVDALMEALGEGRVMAGFADQYGVAHG